MARAADCRSAGPWLKSGCALFVTNQSTTTYFILLDQRRERASLSLSNTKRKLCHGQRAGILPFVHARLSLLLPKSMTHCAAMIPERSALSQSGNMPAVRQLNSCVQRSLARPVACRRVDRMPSASTKNEQCTIQRITRQMRYGLKHSQACRTCANSNSKAYV